MGGTRFVRFILCKNLLAAAVRRREKSWSPAVSTIRLECLKGLSNNYYGRLYLITTSSNSSSKGQSSGRSLSIPVPKVKVAVDHCLLQIFLSSFTIHYYYLSAIAGMQ